MTWTDTPLRKGPRPKIIVSGFFNEILGIGQAAARTADALSTAGYGVVREDLRPLHRGLLTRPPVTLSACDAGVWIIHANPPEAKIALAMHRFDDWKHLYRIGYWAWESSLAPQSWAETARWFHEIWVPSVFVRDAVANSLLAAGFADMIGKIRIMPHPEKTPPPTPRAAHTPGTPVKALCLFDPRSSYERKNPMGAISAWMAAFPEPDGRAHLTVKTLRIESPDENASTLLALTRGRNDITLRQENLSADAMDELVASHDILISLHRAEGFGLALADGMSAGLCVMATQWSGNMDFMKPDNSVLVPARLVPADTRHNGPEAQWAEPDTLIAADALKRLIANPAEAEAIGDNARLSMRGADTAWKRATLSALPFNACLSDSS